MNNLDRLPIPLLEWFRDNARDLPWRRDPSPYHVWLSEIMLQQTRVAAVLDYYRRFLDAAPTIEALASLSEDHLLKLWQGLGYYNRARNLQKAARIIVDKHSGQFPEDYDSVRALPGIGDYTAGAICSIAFSLPVPAVDGNVLRVTARISGDEGDISSPAMKRKVSESLGRLIPLHAPGIFNQAMMELGATVCLPNGAPQCERCPARSFCAAFNEDRIDTLPFKSPKKARRIEQLTVWLIFHNGRVALRRRSPNGLLANLWEFPNTSESDIFPPEWSSQPLSPEFLGTAKHIFTHIEWHMTLRMVQFPDDLLPHDWVWADEWELAARYAIPGAFDHAKLLALRHLNFG